MSSMTTEVISARIAAKQMRPKMTYVWVWIGVILIYILALWLTPNQASLSGLAAALPYVGLLAIVTIGQTLVVMQRGMDFSVVGIILMTGMCVGTLTKAGWGIGAAVIGSIVLGLIAGLVNGLIVVYLRITPLVATLAANGLYLSIALILSNGAPVKVAPALKEFARSRIGGISWIFIIAVVLLVVVAFLLSRSVLGKRFTAVGSNPSTANASGIPVNSYILLAYALAGALYGAAGVLLAAHVGDSRMTSGGDYLMASIAAVVIGGTPLTGGRGSLVASFGGAVFVTLLTELVLGLGASKAIQLLVQALVLIVAVALPNLVRVVKKRGAQ